MDPLHSSVTTDGRHWIVRPYQDIDRARVRWICARTGFVGHDIAPVFDGDEEFADLFSSYNTDYESEHCFVAEVEGKVEGYILGCPDTARQAPINDRLIMPMVKKKMLRNGWFWNRKNLAYVYHAYRSKFKGELWTPMDQILRDYPAHLHINIADGTLRGQGVGKAMMNAYLDHLRALRVTGVHLGTTNHNTLAVPFYDRLGFKVIFQRRVTFYDHVLAPPVYHLVYGLDLR